MPSGPKYTNALAKVTNSPYLLQHAHNPVDWHPWCEEVLEKAKQENKPIFLSIGYSTCHWCHVMAHESFENEDIAKMLNENFLSIKVDRETQPDVDATYMIFVQATTHHGGWPLSVFLTPELHPIFGGTYFPPVDQLGRPGFSTVLRRIAAMWKSDADKLRQSGMNILQQLRDALTSSSSSSTGTPELESFLPAHKSFVSLCGRFDSVNGGFSFEPKFPTPVTLHFLLRYHCFMSAAAARASMAESATIGDLQRLCDELGSQKGAEALEKKELVDVVKTAGASKAIDAQKALDMTCFTLKKIACGGIHDHIGSGFHRYSTDERWHVPHFEKMLYDQAQLACAYAEAYSVTKEKELEDAARDIMQYVKESLTHPEGGFYSAEDADSYSYEGANRKKEGAFYVFTADEIASLLKGDDFRIFSMHYGVEQRGNVDPDKDVQGELENQNVLMAQGTPVDTARKAGVPVETVRDIIERGKSVLKVFRKEKRPPPHLDDKVLVAWNGLMISGCVTAGNLLEQPEYIGMADRAAAFIRKYAYDEATKKLCRSVRGKDNPISTGEGFADDYAYLIRGLLDLYEATFRESYALWAIDLQRQQDALFWDANGGGYFASREKPDVVLRLKPEHDGAEPSAGSITAENLIRLGGITGDASYEVKAKELFKSYQATLAASPTSMPYLVASLMMANKGSRSVIITGNSEDDETVLAFRHATSCCFVPDKVLWLARPGGALTERNQIGKAMVTSAKDLPTAFICATGVCALPIEDPAKLQESLLAK